jgi:uncharacterized protein
MSIVNLSKNYMIAEHAWKAQGFWSRARGLIGKKLLRPGEALLIPHCQAIHMFFMRFSIDVIFIDKHKKVVGLVKNIKPFQLSPFFFMAREAIELVAGTIDRTKTSLGDQIIIDETDA